MDEVIKSLSEKAKQKQDPNYLENLKKERKEKKERLRKEYNERMNSHLNQYINKDQFSFFNQNLQVISKQISDHSNQVDEIEIKLIEIYRKRQERRDQRVYKPVKEDGNKKRRQTVFAPVNNQFTLNAIS